MYIQTRVPSVPLITNDPYFSIWSSHDRLYDGDLTHWDGQRKQAFGTVTVDGTAYRFLGIGRERTVGADDTVYDAVTDLNVLEQVGLEISSTASRYTFENKQIRLQVRFTSPLLLTDPELISRPCTYLDFTVQALDGQTHEVCIILDVDEEWTHDDAAPQEVCGSSYETRGYHAVSMGKTHQAPLCHSGDHITIDWGYLYLAAPQAQNTSFSFVKAKEGRAFVRAVLSLTVTADPTNRYLVAAYDDLASINYFGDIKKAYWTKFSATIFDAVKKSIDQHDRLLSRCDALDEELRQAATASINEDYAHICALAYRQSIAGHKLIEDNDGNLIFLSKENDSNGCIGTVDISYPSAPLFLLYNTEYVKGMLRPVFKFAACDSWEYDFAPHDVGRYPYATGQVYGVNSAKTNRDFCRENGTVYPPLYAFPKGSDLYDFADQMPVEECGNMLILCAVTSQLDGSTDFVAPHFDVLEQWTQYLVKYGSDPGEQLCTDDFAGHLAHNVNLSAKAIMGIQAFALIARQMNRPELFEQYHKLAQTMAEDWKKRCHVGDHTMLTFDNQNSWSLKYNLIWDLYFASKLFDDGLFREEVDYYISKNNDYGVPLDSRADYTKSDWILWCTAMTKEGSKREQLIAPIARYLRETTTRIPFGDWYDTVTSKYCHFINRTVQGGLFMPILMDRR